MFDLCYNKLAKNFGQVKGVFALEVKVKLFAVLAEKAGQREIELDLPAGSTTEDLAAQLTQNWPQLAAYLPRIRFAVNQQYVAGQAVLRPGDEVALIPPVSGGQNDPNELSTRSGGNKLYEITTAPLQVEDIVKKVVNNRAGAVVVFIGTVREFTGEHQTLYLEYEAYQEMAEKSLAEIGREVEERWPGAKIAISHRIGHLDIEEYSVVIAVATPHRRQAFEAGKYAIDRVKEVAPIWKKEVYAEGSHWVEGEEK